MPNKAVTIEFRGKDGQLTAKLKATSANLKRMGLNADGSKRALDRAGKSASGFGRHVQRAHGYIAAFVGLAGLRALGNYADQYTNLSNKIKLVSDSEQAAVSTKEALFAIAKRTRGQLDASVTLYSRLVLGADDLNYSEQELLRVTETLNKQVLIGGNNAAEASAGLVQFAQGIASGRLQGDELRSVMENLLGVQKGLIAGFKNLQRSGVIDFEVTKANIRELASTGVLSSDLLIKSLLSVSAETDAAFSQLDITISQSIINLDNQFLKYIGTLDQSAGGTKAISDLVNVAANNVGFLIDNLTKLAFSFVVFKVGTLLVAKYTAGAGFATIATKGLVRTLAPLALIFGTVEAGLYLYDKATQSGSESTKDFDSDINTLTQSLTELPKDTEKYVAAIGQIKTAIDALEFTKLVAKEQEIKKQLASVTAEYEKATTQLVSAVVRKNKQGANGISDYFKNNINPFFENPEINVSIKTDVDVKNSFTALGGITQRANILREQLKGVDLQIRALDNIPKEEQLTPKLDSSLQQINSDAFQFLQELEAENLSATNKIIQGIINQENALKDSFTRRTMTANDYYYQQTQLARDAFGEETSAFKNARERLAAINLATLTKINQDRQTFQQEQKEAEKELLTQQLANATDWASGYTRALNTIRDETTNWANITENLVTKATDGFADAFVRFAETGKLSFKDLTRSILANLVRIQAQASAGRLLGNLFNGFAGYSVTGAVDGINIGGGLSAQQFPSASNFSGFRANGGNVSAGKSYIVGEKRPELFVPRQSGTILPRVPTGKSQVNNNYNISLNIDASGSESVDERIASAAKQAVITAISQVQRLGQSGGQMSIAMGVR